MCVFETETGTEREREREETQLFGVGLLILPDGFGSLKAGSLLWSTHTGSVSYTHLTLPTNREV